MKRIQKILVRIDPDLVAKPVLELTRQVALAFGARVELIQVFETSGYHGPEVLELADDQGPELEHWRTARVMMGLLKDLAGSGLAVRGRMAFGVAEEEVSRLATEESFDLIILGSHSREGLDRLVQSSVAAALIRKASCPVLVLPHVVDVIPD
jgi:nucleotide-binding universal stress UspA family protein